MTVLTSRAPENGPAARPNLVTHNYTVLAQQIRDHGLLGRRRRFYIVLFSVLFLALGGAIAGVILLGDSWLQLLIAAAAGVLFTQFAFVGHEASHRQVMTSGKANDRIGWLLAIVFVGISYTWWMNKHTRHHGNPNKVGKDPDIEIDTVSFTKEDAISQRGALGWITRHQGIFFFPLLLLEGANLHIKSGVYLWKQRREPARRLELAVLIIRFTVYFAAVFWVLPLGMAFAFIGLQLAVFGLYMGASFAPNHIGMPIVPRDAKLDFLSKQVRTSRNVSGGWWATILMGGLNYQIEHHLFPSMPRPHLAATRRLVREHCRSVEVPYVETNLISAWGIVVRYMNDVGLAAKDAFRCPMVATLR